MVDKLSPAQLEELKKLGKRLIECKEVTEFSNQWCIDDRYFTHLHNLGIYFLVSRFQAHFQYYFDAEGKQTDLHVTYDRPDTE